MAAKWAGGAVAVFAVLALFGRCGADDPPETVSGTASEVTAPTATPQPIQPALAAPPPTTAVRATTTAPTTTRPAPTTTPAPQPAPRPQPRPQPQPEPQPQPRAGNDDDEDDDGGGRSVSYKNCTAARAAGAAPVHRGEPGYASHLDRDGDGVGCE
jgi:outer membrane biosynthesis protein TonB